MSARSLALAATIAAALAAAPAQAAPSPTSRPLSGTQVGLGAGVARTSAAAPTVRGPAGAAFYRAPKGRIAGAHGSVVWTRAATGLVRMAGAGRDVLVLYRSRSFDGTPIAVSGSVHLPKGRPPAGGWPIVSWAHQTVGAADSCAPSRVVATSPERDRMQRGDPLTRRLLKAGIAVARTDYQGLGTPGPHPYLSGLSEARSVIDIVRAARVVEPRIGRRWAVIGHSQGGQAALFTAAIGDRWAPELRLRGAASLAPASHMSQIVALASSFTTVNPITGGLSALGGMILDGAAIVRPSLRTAYADGGLSPAARTLMKDVGDRCLEALGRPDSWGGIAPAAIIGPAADKVHLLYAALDAGDAAGLRIPAGVPVRLEQGLRDLVVFPQHTQALYDAYRARGTDVTYVTYPQGDHAQLAGDGFAAGPLTAWAMARLR